ncbi:L,D-transpeptidase family protein [Pedobacter endophyticus]|uniref:L,D-transpeptidase family protein n=1 Tax=Pedobacter endophyticus TaxID=2789740 RepID=A0A7U3Q3M0_9SPHI|nr:L,D-transpeptidase family protein [Pedobacter endophyticus]QPH37918.1 L,D-transpeptidase family protein [Pedobacter endophyticus]
MPNISKFYTLILFLAFAFSDAIGQTAGDATMLPTARNNFRLDAHQLAGFILDEQIDSCKSALITKFYTERDYQYAWVNEQRLTRQALTFWSNYQDFLSYSADSALRNPNLFKRMVSLAKPDYTFASADTSLQKVELAMTTLFLNFIDHAYAGKVNPKDLQWNILRKRLPLFEILNQFVAGAELKDIVPIYPMYYSMKEKLDRLKKLEEARWSDIIDNGKLYKLGDTGAIVQAVKCRLNTLGDLPEDDGTNFYSSEFEAAVINFQKRHGLANDGIIGPKFIKAINIPITTKIEKVRINMERMRWMPVDDAERKVVVNIPEFRLRAYERGKEAIAMDIVVGKTANRTAIFSDQIRNVVFSPYWNIPESIVKDEILPGIKENPSYLAQHNMEITGRRNGLPVIRQKPGSKNALGRVKFIFPNQYSIYLHDTPAKDLFELRKRAFSHGCIRVAEPVKLASYLLKAQPQWTAKKIVSAMNANTERWIKIEHPVQIFISYFTAWVDQAGALNFRDDLYHRDEELAACLFDNSK